jgi:transposase
MSKGRSNKIVIKSYDRGQDQLLPPSLDSFISINHPARIVSQVVDKIDISKIIKRYKGGGTSIYDPKMLLKVIIYAYLNNIYSCRDIAHALKENVAFMWLAGRQLPDFRTINLFRGERLAEDIESIFTEVVKLLVEQGLLSLKTQYLDGTKIESASNKYTFVWRKTVEKNMTRLQEQIKSLLKEIRRVIEGDSSTGNDELEYPEIPESKLAEAIETINEQLKKVEEIASKTERKEIKKAMTKARKLETEMYPKLLNYQLSLEKLGDRNSYSKTDEDATFMRMKGDNKNNGQPKPGYNVQITTENQVIANFTITQKPGDTTTLKEHIESFKEKYGSAPEELVADAGYGSEENYDYMESENIENYVKYGSHYKEQSRKYQKDIRKQDNLYYNEAEDYFVCPMGQHMAKTGEKTVKSDNGYKSKTIRYEARNCVGCPLRGACYEGKMPNREIVVNHNLRRHKAIVRENLNSPEGIRHRKKRGVDVESVFGNIKRNKRFNRFQLRSLKKVRLEFGLIAISHNLKKLIKAVFSTNPFIGVYNLIIMSMIMNRISGCEKNNFINKQNCSSFAFQL